MDGRLCASESRCRSRECHVSPRRIESSLSGLRTGGGQVVLVPGAAVCLGVSVRARACVGVVRVR